MINKAHHFEGEPECVFCGCFGPTEEDEPCMTRTQIGRQVAFLIDKLRRIKSVTKESETMSIIMEIPKWNIPEYQEAIVVNQIRNYGKI